MNIGENSQVNFNLWASDEKRYFELSISDVIMKSEEKFNSWFGEDQISEDFLNLYFGRPNEIATNLSLKMAGLYSNKHGKFVRSEESQVLLAKGMWRLISAGWAIATTDAILEDWKPKQLLAVDDLLASSAAKYMEKIKEIPPSDFEWFGFVGHNELSVFHWMLTPLGVLREDVENVALFSELMEVGRWLMLYGISMGRGQLIIQSL